MNIDIGALRREYSQAELDENSVDSSPFEQFKIWFEEAVKADLLEPNAMVLSTTGSIGPTQRTVLLKQFDERGLLFFTNYESKKAKQIEEESRVSILFPWYALERQVMVTGTVEKISKKDSLAYFLSRPFGSQVGAWASKQSSIISSRSILEKKLHEMKKKFEEGKVPLPEAWGGFRILPTTFEFWQGRKNRLHDRIFYQKNTDSQWSIDRLSP